MDLWRPLAGSFRGLMGSVCGLDENGGSGNRELNSFWKCLEGKLHRVGGKEVSPNNCVAMPLIELDNTGPESFSGKGKFSSDM